MKQPDNAPGQSKRADEPPGASAKSGAENDHQHGAENPRRDKVSIEQFCQILGGQIPATTVRRALIGAGMDLADGIEPMRAIPIIADMLLRRLHDMPPDLQRDKARTAAAAAETAEIELGALLAGLVNRDEMRRVMKMAVATYQAQLLTVPGLTPEQRKAVCELLVNLKLDDDVPPPVGRRDVRIVASLPPSRCNLGGA